MDRVHLHITCESHPIRLPPPTTALSSRGASLQRSDVSHPLPVEQRAVSIGHAPRLPARTLPSAVAPPTRAHSHEPAHPHMAGRSLPPTRGRATYLACVVRHASTSSVGWIAAHVVHVAAAEGACRGCVRRARLSALAVGWAGGGVCAVPHRLLRAVGCSIRRQCSHRRCSTVRGGRTDAGGGRLSSERQPRSLIATTACIALLIDSPQYQHSRPSIMHTRVVRSTGVRVRAVVRSSHSSQYIEATRLIISTLDDVCSRADC